MATVQGGCTCALTSGTWTVAIQRLALALGSDLQTWRYLLDAHRHERIFAWTCLLYRFDASEDAFRFGFVAAQRNRKEV